MALPTPKQGEVWWAQLPTSEGHEQHGRRPVLVVSTAAMNTLPLPLVLVMPMTTTETGSSLHVRLTLPRPGRGDRVGYVLPEHVRSLDRNRLEGRIAQAPAEVLSSVIKRLRLLTRID